VITALPEITEFSITSSTDYILLGSDGIFDHLDNYKVQQTVQNELLQVNTSYNS